MGECTMLELKKITFSADEKTILHDVDLIVPDGELLAITGPNGGGKSTLARIIAGIEKRLYHSGDLQSEKEKIDSSDRRRIDGGR